MQGGAAAHLHCCQLYRINRSASLRERNDVRNADLRLPLAARQLISRLLLKPTLVCFRTASVACAPPARRLRTKLGCGRTSDT